MRTFIQNIIPAALVCTLLNPVLGSAQPPGHDPADITGLVSGQDGEIVPNAGSAAPGTGDPCDREMYVEKTYGFGVRPSSKDHENRHQGAKGLTHLLESHIGAVTRPVSTAARLITMVAYIGLDALRPNPRSRIPEGPPPVLSGNAGMDLGRWERDLDLITGSQSTTGTMEILIDGDEFFPRLEESVRDARRSVDIQIYIFDNDDYAVYFGGLLKRRSGEVDVRVVMDGLGSIMAGEVDHESLPRSHVPPRSLAAYLKAGSRVNVRKLPNPWITFDHTKSIIIDSKTAFVGGMNIGREYRYIWHDMMVQASGPVAAKLQEEFNKTWDYAGVAGDLALGTSHDVPNGSAAAKGHIPIRLLKTGIGRSQIYRAQLEAIKRARNYIYIENPYLSDDVILYELILARYRGVDVRVVLPIECNWKAMGRSNALAANEMLAHGIKVYLYPGMSHVKAAVIDGWACLGSANFDKASFRFNREINLATSDPSFVGDLVARLFTKDFNNSMRLTEYFEEKQSDRMYEMLADLM